MAKLRYTGHPFIDPGVATICAFVGERLPENVTLRHLTQVADYLKQHFVNTKGVQNQLNSFFQGAHFTQPKKTKEDKEAYADFILYGFLPERETLENENCTFFPELPAVTYAHRQYFPLLNGVSVGNFSAEGRPGIPISGVALLAVHALPLGALKCSKWLLFHQLISDSVGVDMTYHMARYALVHNRKAIQMMSIDESAKWPGYGDKLRTRYIEAILNARQKAAQRKVPSFSVTGYYFTNFGNSAGIEITQLNMLAFRFIVDAQQLAPDILERVTRRSWKGKPVDTSYMHDTDTHPMGADGARNDLYEALFELPRNAQRFLEMIAGKSWQEKHWPLIEIFLRRVLEMTPEQIAVYRELGDKLVEYMVRYTPKTLRFYYDFTRNADRYYKLRSVIRRADETMIRDGQEPIFTYDKFITAFEMEGEKNWTLARDVIGIRMRERIIEYADVFNLQEQLEPANDEEPEQEAE